MAIGSCIVVTAYDYTNRIGGLAHIMLPGVAPLGSFPKTNYAADAVDSLVKQMCEKGSNKNDIEVCLVGAGNVLKRSDDTICEENIRSTTRILKEQQIPIRTTVLGGTRRKGVFMDVERGDVFYTEGDGKRQVLWSPTASSTRSESETGFSDNLKL